MSDLESQNCKACRTGAPLATADEIKAFMLQLPDWRLVEVDGIQRLQKNYAFKNFARALQFTDLVGEIAERENHHPAILTEWGRVTVSWWTHIIGGLHANDFIMAAKTDAIARDVQLPKQQSSRQMT